MSAWADHAARIITLSRDTFGESTIYQRPGFSAFTLIGVPELLPRLEDVNRGEFFSVTYVRADFNNAPFSASAKITFSQTPAEGGSVSIDNIAYVDKTDFDNDIPYQFFRGNSPFQAAANLAACINALSGAGLQYSVATTPHPSCIATYIPGSNTVTVSYKTPGFEGNRVALVDSMGSLTLDYRFLYGGGPMINDLVTIQNILFRLSYDPGLLTGGGVQLRLEKKAL